MLDSERVKRLKEASRGMPDGEITVNAEDLCVVLKLLEYYGNERSRQIEKDNFRALQRRHKEEAEGW